MASISAVISNMSMIRSAVMVATTTPRAVTLVRRLLGHPKQGFLAGARAQGLVALVLQQGFQQLANLGFVINDQQCCG